jgi:hypothetical protein
VRGERTFSVSIPPHVRHGTRVRLSLEDLGLRDAYVNIVVFIDPDMEQETWWSEVT